MPSRSTSRVVPPFYYPVPNVAAFGDVQLAVTPLYAIWWALGLMPDTAFQLWFLTVLAFNFVAAYILCRRLFTLGRLAAAAGAFLFAFGASRINQVGHYQLMACWSARPRYAKAAQRRADWTRLSSTGVPLMTPPVASGRL